MKKKPIKIERWTVSEKVTFKLAYYENAQRLAMALMFCGYFVQARQNGTNYEITAYTDRV